MKGVAGQDVDGENEDGWECEDSTPRQLRYLIPRGRAAVTSTSCSNSVVGVALVGGYGWLSAMHGSCLNNMVSARVVLADGSVVTCSEHERTELFFAIRGSGGSFGIVAEASFHTHPQKQDVFWGTLTTSIQELESTLDLLRRVEMNLDSRAMISARLEHSPTSTQLVIRLFFNGTEAEARNHFAPLLNLANTATEASMVRFDEVSAQMDRLPDHQRGSRYAYTGVNLQTFDTLELAQICQDFMDQIGSLDGVRYAVLGFDTRSFPASVANSEGCGANAAKIMTYMRVQWLEPTRDTDIENAIKKLGNAWRSKVVLGQKGYPAFCRTGDLKPEDIYGQNLQRLRDLKARYDPHSMWVDRSILAA
ncbi:hypothetical protein PMZ80_002390 [Knufia obscura]|uniref:FAD-binding PCMH-type domain-containing protein n=1 Tax=Knufia obscura TaxID=1635080 RepID=A0ABR0RX59_9EURO|nr:hypothetical protein PMZ80_002390 [Knufia obscura]